VVGGWHIPVADSLHGRFSLLVLFDFSIILSSSYYYFLDKSKKKGHLFYSYDTLILARRHKFLSQSHVHGAVVDIFPRDL
jgi:hypothetical protein